MNQTLTAQNVPPSRAVVETVATREGVAPTELEVPLFDAVDPDALNALLESLDGSDPRATVQFTYYGYDLTVHADGTVRVLSDD